MGRKKILVGALLVTLPVIILSGYLYFKNKPGEFPALPFFQEEAKEQPLGLLVYTDEGVKEVDLSSGESKLASAIDQGEVNGYAGLPSADVPEGQEATDEILLIAESRQKFVAMHTVLRLAGEENVETPAEVVSQEQYVCEVAKKECTPSDILKKKYQGIDEIDEAGQTIWWSRWDDEKGLLYGNMSNAATGDYLPAFVCDPDKARCRKTELAGYAEDFSARVPQGAFSPSLKKIVIMDQHDIPGEKTGIKWDLLLYDTQDLSKPEHSLDISAAADNSEDLAYDMVYSVAWSGDEKSLALATSGRIYLFELESSKLTLLYLTPADNEDVFLDSGALAFSPDGKKIAFVEGLDTTETTLADLIETETENAAAEGENPLADDSQDESLARLKVIDLEKKNAVKVIIEAKGLGLKIR